MDAGHECRYGWQRPVREISEGLQSVVRHCEPASAGAAIQSRRSSGCRLDCFAALAMTGEEPVIAVAFLCIAPLVCHRDAMTRPHCGPCLAALVLLASGWRLD